jgi:Flp pilus assembly protein TadG
MPMGLRRLSPFKLASRLVGHCPFPRDIRGAATVEFVLLFPVAAGILGLVMFGGQGFEIHRKLTMTVRTLADLATQQSNVGLSSATYTYSQLLTAASLVMTPYGDSNLSMTLSEIQTNGAGAATVVWSQATANGTPLAQGSTVTVPSNFTTAGYLILGQAQYNFNPLSIFYQTNAITLSSTLYLAPRVGASIACCS